MTHVDLKGHVTEEIKELLIYSYFHIDVIFDHFYVLYFFLSFLFTKSVFTCFTFYSF